VFEKDEKTEFPPHRPGVDLEINLEEGKGLPTQKIYPLGANELEALWEYIDQNETRRWIRETATEGGHLSCSSRKKTGA